MIELIISFFLSTGLFVLAGKLLVSQAHKLEKIFIQDAQDQILEIKELNSNKIEGYKQSFQNTQSSIQDNMNLSQESLELLSQKLETRQKKTELVSNEIKELELQHKEILEKEKDIISSAIKVLEKKVNKSKEDLKQEIIKDMDLKTRASCQTDLTYYVERTKKFQERVSNNILKSTIQRVTAESSVDKSSRILKMPSKNSFQRILKDPSILEIICQTLGVEIEPLERDYSFRVSSFIMWNSEIAKKVLSKMALSFKFDASKLEATIEAAKKEFQRHLISVGKKALAELGLKDQSPYVCEIVGRLNYRTSYGQNILKHSFETAYLCSLIAAQLGADQKVALLGGFFHDVGKALDQEVEGSHDILGMEFLKENGFPFEIYHPAHSHHHAVEIETLEAQIVIIGDKLSASRQGARTESMEMYLQRVQGLERIAREEKLVQKSFAVSAGREIRAYLNNNQSKDSDMSKVASNMAQKIQEELVYPGKIKVNIIREFTSTSIANKK
ncbi:hypothetical protein CL656_01430 [bacterium]|nr:hypothetical protein [bacterium]|tara:strand:- start:1721 stop:3223 length:1503 start_codon:yes stop_codon:yes gene_type:complete